MSQLGIYGFGGAAHIVAQVARHEGREVYAIYRSNSRANWTSLWTTKNKRLRSCANENSSGVIQRGGIGVSRQIHYGHSRSYMASVIRPLLPIRNSLPS